MNRQSNGSFEQDLRALTHMKGQDTSDFDLNPDLAPPLDQPLRPAAVLVAFEHGQGGWRIWLTLRSPNLRHHPRQIAFPGGKLDPDDASPQAGALREAREEINLDEAAVKILGVLAPHTTVSGFSVTPVLGILRKSFQARPASGEVSEAFHVPARHVLCQANYRIEARRWNGVMRRYYAIAYGPYYIWGATARILFALAQMRAANAT